ncbi:isoprenylcysteine carboxylmethyltransferase family protein [Hyphomicrobium sp.]|jgi:protein-S-isoprenylcysteine O-methyltransferase Ste14|uniref:methyltransferase family protein n=1 Tax=Hyphomicrobium sp. TaxID=82 RepID=UPI002BD06417|nr:isoprenylcysteine carboxylmethyltransferase family protein [Hyphomicrobium sp.]HVZ04505.1 isoprenylcysteine carboxylmethyltransferase family protein [Hyphomicrobium sp.]
MTEQNVDLGKNPRANRIPWPPLLLIASIAAGALATWVWPLPWPGINDGPAHGVGLGFGVAGIALIVWAIITLRKRGTTFLPDGTATSLVTSGPFARFRNPIYLGDALIVLSIAEITHSIWFVAAALLFGILVTALQIVPEERHLESQFGDAYLDYKSRTRRWI